MALETYLFHVTDTGNGLMVDIDAKDLTYCQIGTTHHGAQCNHAGDTDKAKEILKLCNDAAEIVKKIYLLNKQ